MTYSAFEIQLPDPAATEALGRALASVVRPGMLVTLSGPLGSGKTALTRAMLAHWGYQDRVKSPTYTLVELYDFEGFSVSHFDFYRFGSEMEADDAGFREHFNERTIAIVEWPEKAQSWLPPADIEVQWIPVPEGRRVRVSWGPRVGWPHEVFLTWLAH